MQPSQYPSVGGKSAYSTSSNQSSSEESNPSLQPVHNGFYRCSVGELQPLPLENSPLPKEWFPDGRLYLIKGEVFKVLQRHGVLKPASFDDLSGDGEVLDGAWFSGSEDEAEDDYITIVNRHPPGDPASARQTILIESDWDHHTSSTKWPSTLIQVQIALNSLEGPVPTLDIELISTLLTRDCFVYPILGDEVLRNHWNNSMVHEISNILEQSPVTRGLVNAIILSRFGSLCHPTKNEITVFIAVETACKETEWMVVIQKIEDYLKMTPRVIGVWFEHNRWDCSAFRLVPPSTLPGPLEPRQPGDEIPYRQRVNLGADISASTYTRVPDGRTFSSTVGTLGCYVQVKYQNEVLILGLTNYHVIRPCLEGYEIEIGKGGRPQAKAVVREGTALNIADRQGLNVQTEGMLRIEHPSRHKHNRVMAHLRVFIEKAKLSGKDPENCALWEREKKDKQNFFDNEDHLFGRIWAASGFTRQSHTNKRLDWALIQVNQDRQGTNVLPDNATWKNAGYDGIQPGQDGRNRLRDAQPAASISKMEENTSVWKMGATTGPTCGRYTGYHQFASLREARYVDAGPDTYEFCFEPPEGRMVPGLAASGDSGAVVYNTDGVAVGLVFTGLNPNKAKKGQSLYTLVTPIEEVFEDIKQMTGIEDIAIV